MNFTGVNCASCVESLPGRLKRIRGVDEVRVNAERGAVVVELAGENRVRPEQIRDAIQQDGTRVSAAKVVVRGTLSETQGRPTLKPSGSAQSHELLLDSTRRALWESLRATPDRLVRVEGEARLTAPAPWPIRVEALVPNP